MPLIDFHAHLMPTQLAKARLLEQMHAAGVARTVVVAGGLISPQILARQIAEGGECRVEVPNRAVWEVSSDGTGRILPFYFASPHESVEEYRRFGSQYYGLKLGPAVHGVALNDSRNRQYVEAAKDLSHPVYLHCLSREGFDVKALVSLAANFPGVTFVLGHAGIGNCDFYGVDLIEASPNIFFETSGGFSSVVNYAATKLGIARLLFGSEFPLQDTENELHKLKRLGLSMERLSANAAKLLRLKEGTTC